MANVSVFGIPLTKEYSTPGLSVQLDKLYDQLDRPGNRLTQAQFFNTKEYQDLLEGYFGSLNQYVPPGSQIVNQSASSLTYKDELGYLHTLNRDISGGARSTGQITQTTNRPNILPSGTEGQQQDALSQVLSRLTNQIGNQSSSPAFSGLQGLDENTKALLKTISDAENARLNDQFQKAQGTSIAQLVGNGVGSSSIAGQIMNQLLQGQGLVQQQASADQANRQLTLQQYLTNLFQQNQQFGSQQAMQYLNTLLGDQTQRQLAEAGLAFNNKQLDQTQFQNLFNNTLQQTQQQNALQQQYQQANSFDLGKAIAAAASAVSGLGDLSGMFSSAGKAASAAPAAINTISNIPNTVNFQTAFNPFK